MTKLKEDRRKYNSLSKVRVGDEVVYKNKVAVVAEVLSGHLSTAPKADKDHPEIAIFRKVGKKILTRQSIYAGKSYTKTKEAV